MKSFKLELRPDPDVISVPVYRLLLRLLDGQLMHRFFIVCLEDDEMRTLVRCKTLHKLLQNNIKMILIEHIILDI